MLDLGIEIRIVDEKTEKFPKEKLVAVKGAPATGQAGGTVETTTSSDPTKVYIPDRPDTGDLDFTYNYSAENYTAVKTVCDNTTKKVLIKYPDGTGALYKGVCQTWRNEVTVGGLIECTLHTVPSVTIEDKTVEEVTALITTA
ncbi:MAG: hypothetical protein KH135_00605 [Firmicutes bacterium]|nr:hypothetical protein [Bacillota bacterium]